MYKENKICVLIPAFNEELLIGMCLLMPTYVDCVLVVNDGSTDRTAEIAKSHGAIVVSHITNRGVGASLQTGISRALESGCDIVVNIDADNQFNPADIEKLINPIVESRADFVTASRFKIKEYLPKMSKIKLWGNKLVAVIVSRIINQKLYDVSCGFRAYSRDTLLKLNLHGKFTYTHESILMLAFQNTILHEEPIMVRGTREVGESKVASSIIKYGTKTLRIILQTYRDYEPFKLFNFVGSIFLIISLVTGIFMLSYYVTYGVFTPYKWIGALSGVTSIIYLLLLLMGFILESLSTMRRNQEKILYLLKKHNLNT